MWKAAIGQPAASKAPIPAANDDDDDWETDPDFVNDVSEEQQRWGSATVVGSGRTAGAIDMAALRRETEEADARKKKQQMAEGPQASFGYGGKFGVEKDRMDKSALGHDYLAKLETHESQRDYSTGFGGKYGVQTDRVDKSALTWDYKEKVEKHASQTDYSSGFGGKFGVQTDRQDKSALGWDHVERVDKHISQKDYSVGFGGKFGVQTDRQDKSAVGWDHIEKPQMHESQTDHKIGFGGKFGVQTDRMDKSAVSFDDSNSAVGTTYKPTKPDIAGAKPGDLRAKFENMKAQAVSAPNPVSSPAQRKSLQSRAAMFNTTNNEVPKSPPPSSTDAPKHLNQQKLAMFSNSTASSASNGSPTEEKEAPKKMNQARMQFLQTDASEGASEAKTASIKNEINQLRKQAPEIVESPDPEPESVVKEVMLEQTKAPSAAPVQADAVVKEDECVYDSVEGTEENEYDLVDTELSAVALYDYQADAEDEISFDPDDIITHVECIDEGWWRGLCKGRHGLFPANYVQLQK